MAASETYYDDLETRSADQRQSEQYAALRALLSRAKSKSPYWQNTLADIDPDAITDPAALAKLPVTRKTELADQQQAVPPLGGLNTVPVGDLAHVFMSPGNVFEPDSTDPDHWHFARALFAAGARKGDLVHNTFSYHLTPAGTLVETAARALGCPVFPAGVGNTELQVQAMAHLRPAFYAGTPSFLKILLDKAQELGADVSSVRNASVGAEPFPPSLRQEFADRGVAALQTYGTADLGLVSYESSAIEGMIVDEAALVEIVRPGTGDPVPEGEVGEIVVTNLNSVYPLIRFATGDMSAVMAGQSPCGRTNMRIKGWMGRADQSAKVRGMFVHPKLVNEVLTRHAGIAKARLVLTNPDNRDVMTLVCEADGGEALESAMRDSIQTVMKLRGDVEFVAAGSLPNDGKVIDDQRKFD